MVCFSLVFVWLVGGVVGCYFCVWVGVCVFVVVGLIACTVDMAVADCWCLLIVLI